MRTDEKIDYSLYLVTDSGLAAGRSLLEIVISAVRGGVSIVQLREKNLDTLPFLEIAKALKEKLDPLSVPLIINDRLDIAMATDADGIHLGQSDIPFDIARKILGNERIIGVSVNTIEEAIKAESQGADYLGISPVWKTPTKVDTPPEVGLAGIEKICAAVRIPLVGIGGINAGNAASVIRAGCDGVAVVSAIMGAVNPETAATQLRREVELKP